jgi:hypothetical protein
LGGAGGASGSGFAAPTAASITNPTSQGQIDQSYAGNQNALQSQNALLGALQGQGGLSQQSALTGQLANTAAQYQNIANGTGPNPALAQLAQSTNQNVNNQAALMAGQRGSSANAGLIARQAAQQGASTQQQAVGQAATLSAQQQLAGLSGLQGAQAAQTGLANQMAGQQIGATTANTQAQQGEQNQLLSALQGYNTQQVNMQSNINNANAGLAQTTMGGQQSLIGGALNGLSAGLFKAQGGVIMAAEGVDVEDVGDNTYVASLPGSGPQSEFGKFLHKALGNPVQDTSQTNNAPKAPSNQLQQGSYNFGQGLGSQIGSAFGGGGGGLGSSGAAGGSSGAVLPGAADAILAADGGDVGSKLKKGGKVPGKAKVEGPVNSYANDTVHAMLSPSEIVLPRSVTLSKDPVRNAATFVAATLQKRKSKGKK